VLGAVPFAGSLLLELAGTIIPNQRIDRIVKFARALEMRLSEVERRAASQSLKNEEFTDLLEESLRQAANSTSDQRRDYLADLVQRSLTDEDISFQESKHLLRLLGELNDVEVIWLRFYREQLGDSEFREKHKAVLSPVRPNMQSSRSLSDQEALQASYKDHLAQLGLLRRHYRISLRTKEPEFDRKGAQEVAGYEISALGRLLLRQIGLGAERPG
jgi:hypothetical protein